MGRKNIAPLIRQIGAILSYPHASAALPPETEHRYPLCRMLGGLQSRSGHSEEEKNLLPLVQIRSFLHLSQLVLVRRFCLFSGHGLPDLLPQIFLVPWCRLPGLSVEQIYVIPPYGILPSTSRLSHKPSSSETSIAFWGVTRIIRIYRACPLVYIYIYIYIYIGHWVKTWGLL